jgi:hypothetical protein
MALENGEKLLPERQKRGETKAVRYGERTDVVQFHGLKPVKTGKFLKRVRVASVGWGKQDKNSSTDAPP